MKVSEANTVRVRGSRFRAIAWILLLAFTLQSFVTQTHMHAAADSASPLGVANTPTHKNAPADNGRAECPFCQAIAHAGAFYVPPEQTLVLPLSWAKATAAYFVAETFVRVSSHLWKSRAPPRH